MDDRTNGNWLWANGDQLDYRQAPFKPSIEEVDRLADELASEHNNETYRSWYCALIYEFGIERIKYWQKKSRSGDFPGRLFGFYAAQARKNKPLVAEEVQSDKLHEAVETVHEVPNDLHILSYDEMNRETSSNIDKTLAVDDYLPAPAAIPWMNEDD